MRCIVKSEIYFHRGKWIIRHTQGICVEGYLELFPTFTDAKHFINKILDGSNEREPIIIGMWSEDKE